MNVIEYFMSKDTLKIRGVYVKTKKDNIYYINHEDTNELLVEIDVKNKIGIIYKSLNKNRHRTWLEYFKNNDFKVLYK